MWVYGLSPQEFLCFDGFSLFLPLGLDQHLALSLAFLFCCTDCWLPTFWSFCNISPLWYLRWNSLWLRFESCSFGASEVPIWTHRRHSALYSDPQGCIFCEISLARWVFEQAALFCKEPSFGVAQGQGLGPSFFSKYPLLYTLTQGIVFLFFYLAYKKSFPSISLNVVQSAPVSFNHYFIQEGFPFCHPWWDQEVCSNLLLHHH